MGYGRKEYQSKCASLRDHCIDAVFAGSIMDTPSFHRLGQDLPQCSRPKSLTRQIFRVGTLSTPSNTEL
eukprot:659780-Prorocentrum_minimum.AAC.3